MSTTPTNKRREANKPQVWIGCLACYNDGRLVGDWVDAIDADDIDQASVHQHPEMQRFAAHPSHDELWCFDHDNMPMSGEFQPSAAVPWGTAYAELDDDELWWPYLRWCRDVLDETTNPPEVSRFRAVWRGEWEDADDFAWQEFNALEVMQGMTREQQRYFDTPGWIRDFLIDFHVFPSTREGRVWIYDARG